MKTIPFSLLMTATAVQTSNLETTQAIYACFGQGDIPGIISKLRDDVEWVHYANPPIVPFGGTRNGHYGALDFFQAVGQNIQISVFEPSNFRVEGNRVINDIYYEATVIATGEQYSSDETFHWTFDGDGKAVRWECTGDKAKLSAVFGK